MGFFSTLWKGLTTAGTKLAVRAAASQFESEPEPEPEPESDEDVATRLRELGDELGARVASAGDSLLSAAESQLADAEASRADRDPIGPTASSVNVDAIVAGERALFADRAATAREARRDAKADAQAELERLKAQLREDD